MKLKSLLKAGSLLLSSLALVSLTSCGGGGGGSSDDFTVRPSSLEGVTLTLVGNNGAPVTFTFNATDATADISNTNPVETGGVIYTPSAPFSTFDSLAGAGTVSAFWPQSVGNLTYTYQAISDTIGSISIQSNTLPQFQEGISFNGITGIPHAYLNANTSLDLSVTFQQVGNTIGTSGIVITNSTAGPGTAVITNNLTFSTFFVGSGTGNVTFSGVASSLTPPTPLTAPIAGQSVSATTQGNFSIDGSTAANLPVNYSSSQSNLNFTGTAPVTLSGVTLIGTNFTDPTIPGTPLNPMLNFEFQFNPTVTTSPGALEETGTLNITGTTATPPRNGLFGASYVYTRDNANSDTATLVITPLAPLAPPATFTQGGTISLNFTTGETNSQRASGSYTTPGNATTPANEGTFTTQNVAPTPPFTTL